MFAWLRLVSLNQITHNVVRCANVVYMLGCCTPLWQRYETILQIKCLYNVNDSMEK